MTGAGWAGVPATPRSLSSSPTPFSAAAHDNVFMPGLGTTPRADQSGSRQGRGAGEGEGEAGEGEGSRRGGGGAGEAGTG